MREYICCLAFISISVSVQQTLSRGVIWGGLGGAVAPPPRKNKKEKKERKKGRKKRKKRRKMKERKKGTMNNVKLLHIKCYFSNFSIFRWHWKIKKNFGPPQEKVEMTPLTLSRPTDSLAVNQSHKFNKIRLLVLFSCVIICSSVSPSVRMSLRPFVRLFVHLFVRSFARSFIFLEFLSVTY